MRITIYNAKHKRLEEFIDRIVIPYMYAMILKSIDKRVFDSYSKELKLQVQSLLFHREYLLWTRSSDNVYTIMIDENKIVGESSAKLCDICDIINFGSFDYPATHVFTKVFNYIRANFWKMYKVYVHGGGTYY